MSAKSQVCHKCKESRTITQFALDASKKGGRQNTCKPCVNSNRKPKAKTQKTDLKKIIKKDDLKTLKKALEELSFETKRSCGSAAEEKTRILLNNKATTPDLSYSCPNRRCS